MNINKLSLLLVAIFSSVIISCIQNNCGDDIECPEVLPHFSILNIEATNNTLNSNDENSDLIPNGDSVTYNRFYITTTLNVEYHTHNITNGIGTLMACSPAPCLGNGHEGTKSGVKNITVVTLSNFNFNHFENDTINDIISISSDYKPLDVSNFDSNTDDFVENYGIALTLEYFHLKLNHPPSNAGSYNFKVILELNDGEIFEVTTPAVLLNKN